MKQLFSIVLMVSGLAGSSCKSKAPCNYRDYYSPAGGEYHWRILTTQTGGSRRGFINTVNANIRKEGIWQVRKIHFTIKGETYSVVNDPMYYVVFQREPL